MMQRHAVVFTLIIMLASFSNLSLAAQNEYTQLFGKCAEEKNTFDCLKRKALNILDSAVKEDSVYTLNDLISIKRDPKFVVISDNSRSLENDTLDDQLERKFYEYLSSRSIQFTIPGNIIEGRKKKDKYGGMLMMGGLAMAGMMAQLAMGKIAFLAGTALLTAKIALVISAIIGLKKLASGGGGGHEVIYATATEHHGGGGGGGGSYGGGWQRSFGGPNLTGNSAVYPVYTGAVSGGHDLAYSGQRSQS
ncbi:uncharacterized protein [Neodiprion pinetum]|uniref:uncharacterized protein n=1 Tax=Neodiprion pinetum TaxID=441929 RepID=UPI001EDE8D90|nr:uncharacterized protein LOC124222199 [Neodiprion pinetum]